MKLSVRQSVLLILVDERTQWAGDERPGRELLSFFHPMRDPMYVEFFKELSDVSGAGDAAAFRALERKGLIRKMRTSNYAFAITEEGIRQAENQREARR